jgi:hypothetical protein
MDEYSQLDVKVSLPTFNEVQHTTLACQKERMDEKPLC